MMTIRDSSLNFYFRWISMWKTLKPVENGGNVIINYRLNPLGCAELHEERSKLDPRHAGTGCHNCRKYQIGRAAGFWLLVNQKQMQTHGFFQGRLVGRLE